MDAVIADFTQSIDETIFLKNLGDPNDTAIRNIILNLLSRQASWKKKDLKVSVLDYLKKQGQDYPEKDLDKMIGGLTEQAGGGMV